MPDVLKKIFTPYAVLGSCLTVALPLVTGAFFLLSDVSLFLGSGPPTIAMMQILPILAGWFWAARSPLPDTLFARLMPLFLPPLILMLLSVPPFLANKKPDYLLLLLMGSFSWCSFYLTFLIRSEWRCRSRAKIRGAACLSGLVLLCAGLIAAAYHISYRGVIETNYEEASVGHGVETWRYLPFAEDNELVKPASPPSLRITSGYPRLDGAIAAYPLYGAFAQAVYEGLDELDEEDVTDFVNNTNTVRAYELLAEGEVDIFFGAAPSREQRAYAAGRGHSLTETPIGREAFVFFVHKNNPLCSLTQAQIRAIYSGRIRNWKELGGPDEPILAFQRPEGSGSQTTMLALMGAESLVRPLREEINEGMGDVVLGVAAYRNRKNALGYSFRWYVTALFANPDIRLLAIDGIEPTPENIRSGIYPFTVYRLAVTARPLSPQSKSLLDWITGPEGQDLLERVGYVPLR